MVSDKKSSPETVGSVQRVKTRAIGDSQLKVIINMNICSENKGPILITYSIIFILPSQSHIYWLSAQNIKTTFP